MEGHDYCMSMLDELSDRAVWEEFYQYKKEKGHLSDKEERELALFIESESYLPLATHLAAGRYCFGPPNKILINKMSTGKKRIVYSFAPDETMILKLLAYLLYRYEDFFADNLYSFRRNTGARQAIRRLRSHRLITEMYCYKVDISNYFNSINVDRLMVMLTGIMAGDERLVAFFRALLTDQRVRSEDMIIYEEKGVMAGVPVAPFFANVYLHGMDRYFGSKQVLYARYSDDFICFAPTKAEIEGYRADIADWLERYELSINHDKEFLYEPGTPWEFLGICCRDGSIDLSAGTINKMKGRIRRKARSLWRWAEKKQVGTEKAIIAFIRAMNRKLFIGADGNDLTWARWFFPLLTTDRGLKELDAYLQQYIRYLTTGRHSKANYRLDYDAIKALGYRSMVHEYYQHKTDAGKANAGKTNADKTENEGGMT
ncbi:MAG: hypothetical protein LBV33_08915 [Lachnospiraceae bacterium]|jgi:retron-type reverse transcriptase|nr:hypothetical protein [Lachnospiraceae bacterium]